LLICFVIASDLPAKAWQAGAWQYSTSTEIASADFVNLAKTREEIASADFVNLTKTITEIASAGQSRPRKDRRSIIASPSFFKFVIA